MLHKLPDLLGGQRGVVRGQRTVEPQSQVQDLLLPLLRPVARKIALSKDTWPGPDLSVCLRVINSKRHCIGKAAGVCCACVLSHYTQSILINETPQRCIASPARI